MNTDTPDATSFAAVDLGSNSFHMVIARRLGDSLQLVDRIKERVRLAAGLDSSKRLTPESQERALACLERFGQRLSDMPRGSVRALGTNTLRRAKNARSFLAEAQRRLGHPIEIVSGHEEARLVYLGVAHSLADDAGRRLVIDIGGGSTELIIGERFEPVVAESVHMGCVSYSQRFFREDKLTRESFKRAETAAKLELQTLQRRFRELGWEACVGASGTILAITQILQASGWSDGGVDRPGLRRLRKAIVTAGSIDRLDLPTLNPERAPVLPGGLAILIAAFDQLKIERLRPSDGALREGALWDLLGRIQHEDVRERTIHTFRKRYHVDLEQADRVERTALDLLEQVAVPWKLRRPEAPLLLAWAARLHEIGLAVSYSGHHKHGSYLVANAEMPGFSIDGRRALAALIRAHRRRLSRASFEDLAVLTPEKLLRLSILLRLAVLRNRARSARPLPHVIAEAPTKRSLILRFPDDWEEQRPLTRTDLEAEARVLAQVGYRLSMGNATSQPGSPAPLAAR
jgi:exopolyphosphatase / guanosine-5'-triphosphate,3'-diphosphate pyrophosphatase